MLTRRSYFLESLLFNSAAAFAIRDLHIDDYIVADANRIPDYVPRPRYFASPPRPSLHPPSDPACDAERLAAAARKRERKLQKRNS